MESLVVVYKAAGLGEAEIIKGYLESEEIPVHLQYESAGPVYGLTVDGLGEVRVCVPEAFADETKELLRRLDAEREKPEGSGRSDSSRAQGPENDREADPAA